ncbi:MAG: 4Fe-4S binding protein [Planctomycetes bacterium]|nr:4Fe-4S binding protein [Planctomycetota bacterium]
MAHTISDVCQACGACKDVCPVSAIFEGAPYTIDGGVCVDCGACVGECPVSAIAPV